jgi:hypothetical protein
MSVMAMLRQPSDGFGFADNPEVLVGFGQMPSTDFHNDQF